MIVASLTVLMRMLRLARSLLLLTSSQLQLHQRRQTCLGCRRFRLRLWVSGVGTLVVTDETGMWAEVVVAPELPTMVGGEVLGGGIGTGLLRPVQTGLPGLRGVAGTVQLGTLELFLILPLAILLLGLPQVGLRLPQTGCALFHLHSILIPRYFLKNIKELNFQVF